MTTEGSESDKPKCAGNPFNLPKECEEQLAVSNSNDKMELWACS